MAASAATWPPHSPEQGITSRWRTAPGAPPRTPPAQPGWSSTPHPAAGSLERLAALREELRGKILVDVSNATTDGPDGLPADLLYPGSSLAERLQEALPDTRVVKTLNTMLFPVMTAPAMLTRPPTAFLSGEDPQAKQTVHDLLTDLGWRKEWISDLGGIRTARATEAAILFVPHVIRSSGFAPFALSIAR